MMSPDVGEVEPPVKTILSLKMLSSKPTVFDTNNSEIAFKFEFNWRNLSYSTLIA